MENSNRAEIIEEQNINTNVQKRTDIFENVFSDLITEKPIRTFMSVPMEKIVVPQRVRKNSYSGLYTAVKKFGVICPPILMKMNSDKYVLINGGRTIYAAGQNGYSELDCVVYEYQDKSQAKKALLILELIANMHEPYTIDEIWETGKKLTSQMSSVSYEVIEYFLHLRPGEYTKLADLMTCTDAEMMETIQNLKEGVLTIDQAYRKLESYRKKLTKYDLLEKMEHMDLDIKEGVMSDSIKTLEKASKGEKRNTLDDETQRNLLDAFKQGRTDMENIDISELNRTNEVKEVVQQDTRSKHPIDPKVRNARLITDNFTCQACGIGGKKHMYILDFHHVVPVMLGGKDEEDNGITLCLNCHQLVHLYASGELPSLSNDLTPEEKGKFKTILLLGNVIIDGLKKRGISSKEYKKIENPFTVGRKYPGTMVREHNKALLAGIKDAINQVAVSDDNSLEG